MSLVATNATHLRASQSEGAKEGDGKGLAVGVMAGEDKSHPEPNGDCMEGDGEHDEAVTGVILCNWAGGKVVAKGT